MTTQIYPGITMDSSVRFGKPCLAGTRIDVATVVGAIGSGDSVEAVQEAYDLTRDQVLAAVRYAAHVAAHLPPAVQEALPVERRAGSSRSSWPRTPRRLPGVVSD